MNLRLLQRTRHTDAKESRGAPDKPQPAEPYRPELAQMPLVRLQSVIGNQNVQRMLSKDIIEKLTGSLKGSSDTLPDRQTTDENTGGLFGGIVRNLINQPARFSGDEEFHAKALPKNQYYASKPPSPGWPYTDQLRALWDAGQFNDFADEVATYQQHTLKLPEAQVDGILGPKTSRSLRQPDSDASPAPSAEGTPAATTDPNVPTTTTGESAATTTPTPTATPAPDDSAVSGHPAVARIVTPVKEAFNAHKEAEKLYQAADSAVSKAKKDEKASKEDERQTEMGKMEEKRAAAREVMAAARAQIAVLDVGQFSSAAEMKQVIGYINRQLNAHSVYYTQMSNANILYGNNLTAAWRTCNMTVISMMLEASGKSSKDYTGDVTKLQKLAGDFDEALDDHNTTPADLTSLRLPDFLQLVAIDVAGSRAAAAEQIVNHEFIIRVARRFGLKTTEIKNGDTKDRGEKANWFLGTKHTSKLDAIGKLYRPAESKGRKALAADAGYKDKALKGKAKEEYARKFMADFTETQRLQFVSNIDAWTDIDTLMKVQLDALLAEIGQPNSTDPTKPRFFDTEFQAKAAEVMEALKAIAESVPKEFGGKLKKVNAIVASLNTAIKADGKKPGAPPRTLTALLDGKGDTDALRQVQDNLKKYASLKGIYEKLGEEGGAEELVPVEDYKDSIIPTMQAAIEGGNQVMVNLDNHFVRLQSVSDDGFVIDDPGSRFGEDNKISWEQGRKHGYFQHYLLLRP